MTEVRIVPRVRTETETIKTPVSKCGENWFQPVRIRAPYKSTDLAFRTLPSLGDPQQIESYDPMLLEEIVGDCKRIAEFVRATESALSQKQKANIWNMISRATKYVSDAARIATAWAQGFATTTVGTIPAWALGRQPSAPVNNVMEEGHHRDSEKYKSLLRAALRNLRCAEEVAKKETIRQRNKERRQGYPAR
jgi:hypothetical protein